MGSRYVGDCCLCDGVDCYLISSVLYHSEEDEIIIHLITGLLRFRRSQLAGSYWAGKGRTAPKGLSSVDQISDTSAILRSFPTVLYLA